MPVLLYVLYSYEGLSKPILWPVFVQVFIKYLFYISFMVACVNMKYIQTFIFFSIIYSNF